MGDNLDCPTNYCAAHAEHGSNRAACRSPKATSAVLAAVIDQGPYGY